MASLRPPSTGPSDQAPVSGGTAAAHGLRPINTRNSLQPTARNVSGHTPISPRPGVFTGGGARPTSELLSSGSTLFQNPEAEAIDQWFENLQNYETTLEEMAAASLDVNFKEELSAIEQWFRVLSEAERTAALYSLLQHSTQMQIRFFITVLQQMARSDPMTALLSPAVGASMQSQMEARLASMGLKSPGLPPSPSTRNFSANRQSFAGDPSSYLSPESANLAPSNNAANNGDAASTLAHQRAKLKASNASHRISAPGTLSNVNVWQSGQLGQVVERSSSPNTELNAPPSPGPVSSPSKPAKTIPDSNNQGQTLLAPRGVSKLATDNLDEQLSPAIGGNWASMVNTPLVPMFGDGGNTRGPPSQESLDALSAKLGGWGGANQSNGRVVLEDAKKFRRTSRGSPAQDEKPQPNQRPSGGSSYGGSNAGGNRNNNNFGNGGNGLLGAQGWNNGQGARSPALSNTSGRFGNEDGMNPLAGVGFGAGLNGGISPGMPGLGMGMPNMGMGNMGNMPFNMFNGMPNMNGMNVNALEGMGMNPLQAQIFAAQLAASSGFGNPGMNFPAAAMGMMGGLQNQNQARSPGGRGGPGGRSPAGKTSSLRESGGNKEKNDEEVDPTLLNDVPAWLRSLRLHKYTPNFEGMSWKEMVTMDEAQLEAKGVAALGARRKMLKTFEAVRNKMGIEMPAGSS